MEILYFLIPLSLLVMIAAIWAFFWAVNNKQFDDLDSPASMMLFDDESTTPMPSRGQHDAAATTTPSKSLKP